jgi:uncharacterized protein (TIGR00251 family)
MALLRKVGDGILLAVRLQPGASANRITGLGPAAEGGETLRATVTAAPEKGKANAALIRLLSKNWKLPKSAITVAKGATERTKTIHIAGDADALAAAIRQHIEDLND